MADLINANCYGNSIGLKKRQCSFAEMLYSRSTKVKKAEIRNNIKQKGSTKRPPDKMHVPTKGNHHCLFFPFPTTTTDLVRGTQMLIIKK